MKEIDKTIRVSDISNLNVCDNSNTPSKVYLMDCIEGMKHYPDKYFDLACVDPPYGIDEGNKGRGMGTSAMAGDYTKKDWDKSIPEKEYFTELKRVSKNQIIWGGNYMVKYLEPSMGWIFWDKDSSGDFSDGELAYTSFNKALKKVKITWMGMRQYDMKNKEIRIHPTQKPVALYDWIFAKYASEGDLILDTHLGSGSSRIAANKAGLDFTGFEIDEEYFNASEERFKNFISQTRLF